MRDKGGHHLVHPSSGVKELVAILVGVLAKTIPISDELSLLNSRLPADRPDAGGVDGIEQLSQVVSEICCARLAVKGYQRQLKHLFQQELVGRGVQAEHGQIIV
jgi:hypothetical protein